MRKLYQQTLTKRCKSGPPSKNLATVYGHGFSSWILAGGYHTHHWLRVNFSCLGREIDILCKQMVFALQCPQIGVLPGLNGLPINSRNFRTVSQCWESTLALKRLWFQWFYQPPNSLNRSHIKAFSLGGLTQHLFTQGHWSYGVDTGSSPFASKFLMCCRTQGCLKPSGFPAKALPLVQ